MERGNLGRWLLIAAGIFLFVQFGPNLFGGGQKQHQPIAPIEVASPTAPSVRAPETLCDLWGDRFHAKLTTRGASVKRFKLTKRGKVRRYRAGVAHLNSHKSRKRKRHLRHPVALEGGQVRMIKRLLGEA